MRHRFIFIMTFLCFGCNNEAPNNTLSQQPVLAKDIFPLASFINGQLHLIDSLQPPIVRFSTVNKIIDTAIISYQQFAELARDFNTPDISDSSFNHAYLESSFADQSVPSVILTYTAVKKELEIRRIDVIVKPDPVKNDKVQSIYIEKILNSNNRSVSKKLFWKTNKYFGVVTNTIVPGAPPQIEQLKVIWDQTE